REMCFMTADCSIPASSIAQCRRSVARNSPNFSPALGSRHSDHGLQVRVFPLRKFFSKTQFRFLCLHFTSASVRNCPYVPYSTRRVLPVARNSPYGIPGSTIIFLLIAPSLAPDLIWQSLV